MYEVEIKVELTEDEKNKVVSALLQKGFGDEGMVQQRDFYIKAVESLNNAFDIERYRDEGGKYLYTKKAWEVEAGQPVRREDEHSVTEEEFENAVSQFPSALKIIKDRNYFTGFYEVVEVTFSIDSVKFDHSKEVRYFAEPEIITHHKEFVPEIKVLLRRLMADLLGIEVSQIVEAPGMFAMAYKKL